LTLLLRVSVPGEILKIGLAVATVAFASQSAQWTHRDSPAAVVVFATASILLFTLPRVGASHIPHLTVLVLGFTTVLVYLFGAARLSLM
jgi:hypothetical protein